MTLYTCMQGRRFLSGLLVAAAAAAPASAVVRFRGCGGVCGCPLSVSRNSGSEPYSAGTLRYTLHGSRSFIFAYVHHIVEYLEHEKDPLVREPSTVDLSNALKFLDSEGANALRAHGLQLHKATLREGELMYTPPGMYTLREGLRTL